MLEAHITVILLRVQGLGFGVYCLGLSCESQMVVDPSTGPFMCKSPYSPSQLPLKRQSKECQCGGFQACPDFQAVLVLLSCTPRFPSNAEAYRLSNGKVLGNSKSHGRMRSMRGEYWFFKASTSNNPYKLPGYTQIPFHATPLPFPSLALGNNS